ncbi:MAG: sugar ABC transporter permease [Eubacteriales bacterium]|nr:sugar ABC transporter permease [Eubacteriales bacterium]
MSDLKLTAKKQSKINSAQTYNWRTKKKTQKILFLLFACGPATAGYLLFNLYPNLNSTYLALLDWDGIGPQKFIGLDNFKRMLTDKYVWTSLKNNLEISIIVPLVVITLSLLLAYALTHKDFFEKKIYQNIFFVPNVLSTVVVSLIFIFVFDGTFGLINGVLSAIGVDTTDLYWLGSEATALPSLMIAMIWGGVGTYLIIFMNAMKGIPKDIYESAILDGASNLKRLTKITIPLIWGVIKVSILYYMIGLFKGFEFIKVMTDGGFGTMVLGLYMYNLAFGGTGTGLGSHQYGYASAIGMLLFIILVVAKILIDKFGKRDAVEY